MLPVRFERIRIVTPKKRKNIRINPNKVQLFQIIYQITMPRPSTPQTRYFQRQLTAPEKLILLAAGEGNLIKGFANVLALYQEAHNQGYRPSMETGFLIIGREQTNSPNEDDLISDSKRESIGNG